jgi:hypothetical protein
MQQGFGAAVLLCEFARCSFEVAELAYHKSIEVQLTNALELAMAGRQTALSGDGICGTIFTCAASAHDHLWRGWAGVIVYQPLLLHTQPADARMAAATALTGKYPNI